MRRIATNRVARVLAGLLLAAMLPGSRARTAGRPDEWSEAPPQLKAQARRSLDDLDRRHPGLATGAKK